MALFNDRVDAGRKLAKELSEYAKRSDVIILAIPRGGVPVAFEVAKELNVKMDVCVVRKLGIPGEEEIAMGAIASDNIIVLNDDIVRSHQITKQVIDTAVSKERIELERRERIYRGNRPKPNITGLTVILIDDGVATGATMRAAVSAVETEKPAKIVIAVPTGIQATCSSFEGNVNEVIICASTPEPFFGIGAWYEDFSQTTDEEVCELMKKATILLSK